MTAMSIEVVNIAWPAPSVYDSTERSQNDLVSHTATPSLRGV